MRRPAAAGSGASPSRTGGGPVLVCAATRWEAGRLAGALGLARARSALPEGAFSGRPVALLRVGVGPERTRRALEAWEAAAARPSPALAVSAGLAGGLQDGVRRGDIVADVHGLDSRWLEAARAAAARGGARVHFGPIVSVPALAGSPAAKRALGAARRACAVDMESGALRAWAAPRGIPALAVRVILDAVDDALPAGLPQDDAPGPRLAAALAHPLRWPALAALGARSWLSLGRLGSFLRALLEAA